MRLTDPNAWIEDRVHGIDDDVCRHHESRGNEDDADDHRQILDLDRLDDRESESWESEDAFGNDRTAEHRGQVDAELRDNRRPRAAARMPIHDAPFAQTLGARSPDVGLPERFVD